MEFMKNIYQIDILPISDFYKKFGPFLGRYQLVK